MLKENVDYQVTVTFRDSAGVADETDPEIIIRHALEEFDFDVLDVSDVREVTKTATRRLTRRP